MGLLDFAASIGRKIFGSEAEASDKIKDYVDGANPGVNDFQRSSKTRI